MDAKKRTLLSENLITTYLNADYVVASQPPVTLIIGKQSKGLDALLKASQSQTAALITAFNPQGLILCDSVNRNNNQRLLEEIEVGHFSSLPAEGRSKTGDWPNEPGYLILGIDLHDAKRLGRAFNQNALLFIGYGHPVELVLLR